MGKRKKGLNFYEKKKSINKETVISVGTYIFLTALMILLAFSFVYLFGIKTNIIGDSMEPTLVNGQEILTDRFTYFFSEPSQDDVIVFLPNGNTNSHYYVKRIIGTPGDTVLIKDGMIYVNEKIYDRNGLFERVADGGIAKNSILLGSDEYFVLGDNLNDSEDSRSGNIGVVKKEYILGKAWFAFSSGNKAADFIE
ncbi:MAG: signal peptidase I [Lachnospiraceae bacterium]|jgi:signal peptidase I|nr:signal peptidase I [Lachnospiraceae bacterium]